MSFLSSQPILKGWSDDRKFRVQLQDGSFCLLRISPKEKYANRQTLFDLLQTLSALGVPMPHPLGLNETEDGICYLSSWIDGEDAEPLVPQFSPQQQYALGMEAGAILKTIHTLPAPANQPDWETRFNAKIDRKISLYENCPIHFDGAEHMLSYLSENRFLLKGRPQTFQHGDYHIGNMMLEKGRLVIIDFDRYDFGDPWEEFNRIVWCVQASPLFASGMVDGYFDHNPPLDFWKLLALYISSNMLSSVPWAIPFGLEEVNVMLRQSKDVLNWYDFMRTPIPSWYQPFSP